MLEIRLLQNPAKVDLDGLVIRNSYFLVLYFSRATNSLFLYIVLLLGNFFFISPENSTVQGDKVVFSPVQGRPQSPGESPT